MIQRVLTHWKAISALIVVYIVWGTTFGAVKLGTLGMPPAMLISLRFSIAGVIMLTVALLRGEHFPVGKGLLRHIKVGIMMFFLGNAIIAWSLRDVPSGLGATVVALNPFWMTWLSSIIPPKEKTDPLAFIGLIVGFIGMLILLSPQLLHRHDVSAGFWPGLLGITVMAFFWSFGSVYAKKRPSADSLFMGIGIQNLAAGLLVGCIYFLLPHPAVVHPTIGSIEALTYLIVFGTIVAAPCYLYTIKELPISLSSTFSYVTPIVSIAFGWFFIQEKVTPITMLGTVIILGGVIIVQWVNQRHSHRQQVVKQLTQILQSQDKPSEAVIP